MKLTIAIALAALAFSAPANAVVRGSTSFATYPLGGGKCLQFVGTWYRIVPC